MFWIVCSSWSDCTFNPAKKKTLLLRRGPGYFNVICVLLCVKCELVLSKDLYTPTFFLYQKCYLIFILFIMQQIKRSCGSHFLKMFFILPLRYIYTFEIKLQLWICFLFLSTKVHEYNIYRLRTESDHLPLLYMVKWQYSDKKAT